MQKQCMFPQKISHDLNFTGLEKIKCFHDKVDIPTSSSSSPTSKASSKNPTEPTDLMKSEDLFTSEELLNSEQLEAVEVVFKTLSLDNHGVESVSFRTLLSHYKVDLSNEDIDELFMSISKDGNGFATWATMVEFLRNEIELDPKNMRSHSVLIQAMRKPPKIERLHSVNPHLF